VIWCIIPMLKSLLDRIQANNDKNICNYCGKQITTQELIGALCHNCNLIYYDWVRTHCTDDKWDEKTFIKFIESKVTKFVFR
jgi:wobble nucleotide-excising tRNase